jgi:hypothetical protein
MPGSADDVYRVYLTVIGKVTGDAPAVQKRRLLAYLPAQASGMAGLFMITELVAKLALAGAYRIVVRWHIVRGE